VCSPATPLPTTKKRVLTSEGTLEFKAAGGR